MLILNCTQSAADFFSITKNGEKISPFEPSPNQTLAESTAHSNRSQQWQWIVHAVKVKGKNVLIAMDYHSRFSITLSELKKGDDSAFLNTLENHLTVHVHEMMTAIDASSQAIDSSLERYFQQQNSRAFYVRGDRSAQAHINDVVWHFRRWADEEGNVPTGVDLIALDVFVNQLLRKRKTDKDYFTPQREFLHAWLRHYAEYSPAQADQSINFLRKKERADFDARHPLLSPASDLIPASKPAASSLPPVDVTDYGKNVISLDAYRKKNS